METFLFYKPCVLMLCFGMIVSTGCKKKGCTDSLALNFDSKAKKDDRTCKFSTVIFHVDDSQFFPGGTFDSSKTTVTLDNSTIGTIHGSGSLQNELIDHTAHAYSASTTAYYLGIQSVYSDDGYVTASPNNTSINIDLYQ